MKNALKNQNWALSDFVWAYCVCPYKIAGRPELGGRTTILVRPPQFWSLSQAINCPATDRIS